MVISLADRAALIMAFSGTEVVLTALGVTPTSDERSAMLSENAAEVEAAMLAAGVEQKNPDNITSRGDWIWVST